MNSRSGADRSMTSPPSDGANPRNRVRVALVALFVVLAVGAVVAAIALVPGHHKINTAPRSAGTLSATGAISPSPSAASAQASLLPSQGSNSASSSAAVAPSTSATAVESVPSDPQAALKQQVISGYLAFEKTLNQQFAAIASDMIPLQRVATGQVLTNSEDAVGKLRGKGEVERGTPTLTDVVVPVLSPTSAVVCAMEDDGPTEVVVAKTGAVVGSGFSRYESRTTMVLDKGVWKASVAASVTAC